MKLLLAMAFAVALPAAAAAQGAPVADADAHGSHAAAAAAAPADTAATQAFRDINARMHSEMDIAFTNDVDVDFVRSMIPHHEGAVEMAKVVLEHSSDPELRALAEAVVAAQEAEIAFMRVYLEKRGVAD